MNRYDRLFIFLAAFGVATLTVLAALSGKLLSTQPLAVAQEAEQNDAPIARYQSDEERRAAASQLSAERLNKNRRYDKSDTVEELPPGFIVTPRSGDWIVKVPAIPVAESDIVVVGHITRAEAFLSNDQTGIYSEFTILIDEVIKNDATKPLKSGDVVIAERAGGTVQFPSGRTQRVHVYRGQRMPAIGSKYLFFLKRSEPEADPTILTGYELQQGTVVPLDKVKPYSEYAGTAVQRFLEAVRAQAIDPREKHGKGQNR